MFNIERDILGGDNLFNTLSDGIYFETTGKGRQGAVLIDVQTDGQVPIVRTTTIYKQPAQKFLPIHYKIIETIKNRHPKLVNMLQFNNALIEVYDDNYRTMKYHSDQALDLNPDSYICIFSCYSNPGADIRILQITKKIDNTRVEVALEHNSMVFFSVATNNEYLHRIVLQQKNDNKWLGITFRLSKTFVPNKSLRLATDNERVEFYKYRAQENKLIGYQYPELDYTISSSDLLPVV